MRLKQLRVKNVFQHRDKTFDFEPGTTGIIGRNGSGKSNFLETLYFALSGELGSGALKAEMVNWEADQGYTELVFEDGGHEFLLKRNAHNSGVTLTGATLSKPLKNAQANEHMLSVLGMSFDNLYEACWTPQGSLISLLGAGHAQRVAFFQRLADTQRAEIVRGVIMEEGLNKLPTYPDRTAEIAEIKVKLVQADETLQNASKTRADMETLLRQYDEAYPAWAAIMQVPLTETQYRSMLANVTEALEYEKRTLDGLQQSLQRLGPKLESVIPPELVQAYMASTKRQDLEQRVALAEVGFWDAERTKADLATTPSFQPELQAAKEHMDRCTADWLEAKRKMDMVSSSVCPTCNRPFYEVENGLSKEACAEELRQATAAATTAKASVSAIERKAQMQSSLEASAEAQYQSKLMALNQAKTELAAVPAVPFDPEAYKKALADQASAAEHNKSIEKLESSITVQQGRVYRAECDFEKIKGAQYVTEEHRRQAVEFFAAHENVKKQSAEAFRTVCSAEACITALNNTLDAYSKDVLKQQAVAETRRLFERAREVLHRDNLPKLTMQKMLHGLNALLDQYLSVFETNYSACIDENFDFVCNFATKSGVPARSLSGGQKVALAIAFKFAVSELLANQIPLMVLDEPTVWLDEINKPRLVEVMSKVRDMTAHGVHVLVATHDTALYPAFSRIYDVSQR